MTASNDISIDAFWATRNIQDPCGIGLVISNCRYGTELSRSLEEFRTTKPNDRRQRLRWCKIQVRSVVLRGRWSLSGPGPNVRYSNLAPESCRSAIGHDRSVRLQQARNRFELGADIQAATQLDFLLPFQRRRSSSFARGLKFAWAGGLEGPRARSRTLGNPGLGLAAVRRKRRPGKTRFHQHRACHYQA